MFLFEKFQKYGNIVSLGTVRPHTVFIIVVTDTAKERRIIIAPEDKRFGAKPRENKDKVIMNERIRSAEVRLIDENGENHGVVSTEKALEMAEEADLDLVLVGQNQDIPVAKILNYGKYKYELEKKAKEAKKKQHTVDIKEVKVRYKIDTHDYQVRIKNINKFIAQGNKVKIVVMLRGREMQHSNLAFDLANKFMADLEGDTIVVEKKPQLEGRNVTLFLAPAS